MRSQRFYTFCIFCNIFGFLRLFYIKKCISVRELLGRGGGMERFMELYQPVYRDLYRLAYYYMGNAEDAEDAVQDAALSAYEHFDSLKKEASFRFWIFRILANCCRKSLKKRGRRELPAEELQDIQKAGADSPAAQAEVLELLDILSEEERLIVVLTVFGGYKGEEIARLLHRKHSTVRSKYRRALKKLEQELTREDGSVSRGLKTRRKEVQR